MLEHLIELDKTIFLYLNNLGNSSWDAFWMFITNKFSSVPLYAILLFLAFRQLGLKKTGLLLVFIALLILTTDQLANFFKYGVQRLRPCHDLDVNMLMRLVKSHCGGKYGYFSAHSANSFAIAFFFTSLLRTGYKYVGVILFIWAILVAYSRVYIGVHFPLDIVSGAFIGLFLSWLYFKLFNLASQRLKL